MRVDVRNLLISFAVNGNDFHQMAQIRSSNTPYYLAVSMRDSAGDQIYLMDYFCMVQRRLDYLQQQEKSTAAKISFLEETVRNLRLQNEKLKIEKKQMEQSAAKSSSLEKTVCNLRTQVTDLQVVLQIISDVLYLMIQNVCSVQKRNDKLQIEMQQSLQREKELLANNKLLEDQNKEKDLEISDLRNNVKQMQKQYLDESQYMEWGPHEIAMWLVHLDKQRMGKYQHVLEKTLVEEGANGSLLSAVDGGDLRGWGIVNLADRKFAQQQIEKLVTDHPDSKVHETDLDENEGNAESI